MRRRARRTVFAGTAVALLTAVPAFAATLTVVSTKLTAWQSATSAVCASPGTQTATSNADSWVDQGSPSSNYATDAVLKVRSKIGSINARALVRFTLPALPANCTVTLARLRLYSPSAVTGRTLQALRVNATWAENTVTWTNQPATTGTAATVASGTGWREWTVTSQAAAMYSGANNGFLVRDATEGAIVSPEQNLHAREKASDNPPELVLTFG
jgi:large repetitive protein